MIRPLLPRPADSSNSVHGILRRWSDGNDPFNQGLAAPQKLPRRRAPRTIALQPLLRPFLSSSARYALQRLSFSRPTSAK